MKTLTLALALVVVAWSSALAQVVSDRDRDDALRHYRSGEQALRREAVEEAAREFQQAARLDPRLEIAHYGLGQVYMTTRRYTLAIRAYETCREAFRANAADALQDQSAAKQRTDDRIRALEDARNGYEVGTARTANTIATINLLQQQINQLKLQRGRGADRPEQVPAWISIALGSAFFRNDAFADAEREFREALSADPKVGEAHNNLAVVLMLVKRYDEAEKEVVAAEAAGFKVNPQFKADLKRAAGK